MESAAPKSKGLNALQGHWRSSNDSIGHRKPAALDPRSRSFICIYRDQNSAEDSEYRLPEREYLVW